MLKSGIHYQLLTVCSLVVLWFKPKNNQRTTEEHTENKWIIECPKIEISGCTAMSNHRCLVVSRYIDSNKKSRLANQAAS